MNGLFKKVVAGVAASALVASMSVGAFAEWEFAGYDLTDPEDPGKVYNEIIAGSYTNKVVIDPIEATWLNGGFESVYPYAGFDRMYLEGNPQLVTRYNGLFPQWETRRQDFMWEITEPHRIFERQQTKVENRYWNWDFGNPRFNISDDEVLTPTIRNAFVVKREHKNYGFGKYNNDGKLLNLREQRMYSDFSINAVKTWENLVQFTFTPDKLSERDINNQYVFTDEMISALIPVVQSKYVTAKFEADSDAGLETKDVAAEYLAHMDDGWTWDFNSLITVNNAKISWSDVLYEMAEPYKYYQYMIVNDVVMDGTNGKDYIIRYTGGKASPNVTWNFVFFQHAKDENGVELPNVYEVVEQKYVDGVPAFDYFGDPIYRVPTGAYGNVYFYLNDLDVWEMHVVDKDGNNTLLDVYPNWEGSLGGLINAYMSGSVRYIGMLPPEEGILLP